jgi:uncharacterized protein DUF4124
MHFAGRRLDRERRIDEEIVRPMHAALRRRLLVLLDSHLENSFLTVNAASSRPLPSPIFTALERHQAAERRPARLRRHARGRAGLVSGDRRQSQDHFILDELPYIHRPRREHAIDIVIRFRDLMQAFGKLQLDIHRDGNGERTEAALTHELHLPSDRDSQARLAEAGSATAQDVFQAARRALHLGEAWQLLQAQSPSLLHRSAGKLEAVDHPRLRHKARMILCLHLTVKRNSKLFRALLRFCLLAMALGPVSAQVYKWVDANGVTHYGERPPQGQKATEVPYRLGTPGPAANPANRDDSAKPDQNKPQEERPTDLAKRRERCVQQRDLLAKMRRTPPKYETNDRGERVLADGAQREDAIAKQEQAVLAACSS